MRRVRFVRIVIDARPERVRARAPGERARAPDRTLERIEDTLDTIRLARPRATGANARRASASADADAERTSANTHPAVEEMRMETDMSTCVSMCGRAGNAHRPPRREGVFVSRDPYVWAIS